MYLKGAYAHFSKTVSKYLSNKKCMIEVAFDQYSVDFKEIKDTVLDRNAEDVRLKINLLTLSILMNEE